METSLIVSDSCRKTNSVPENAWLLKEVRNIEVCQHNIARKLKHNIQRYDKNKDISPRDLEGGGSRVLQNGSSFILHWYYTRNTTQWSALYLPAHFYLEFSDFIGTILPTYCGWILSTIPTRLPAPYLTAYKEKKTIKPFTNFVVLDEDKRWKRRTNTCFMYGDRLSLKTININKLHKAYVWNSSYTS